MATSSLHMSTTIMCLFFGTNFLLMLFFIAIQWQKKEGFALVVKKAEGFKGTPKCYTLLTAELSRMGFIMALTYICENHWFFEHSGKEYNRDLFMFVCVIFFGYGYLTITPIKDLALLGREQTEEWKGWMQFIFLLYHYFHAEEVYNSVRVMITCYVWMTGFGNFSFFYIKQDFGWLRVVQMLWRLNFAVVFLMMTHGNTYILYYICPLHTFFFLMVYVTMFIGSSWNHGKWSIRWKLAVLGAIIYLIWDFNHGIFQFLFQWLGTESIIGAKGGSVWEWYFRTSLDHWSTYFGMIFAMNFPLCEQLFVKLKGWPLYFVAVILGGLSVWWLLEIYSLEKLSYNLHHNYFAFIPLTAYIYFRNMTPYVRSFHHVWLTSNAKTLLTIVPGYPWITFALASVMFVLLAKELYRLTMTIRGMILPDDKALAKKNIIIFLSSMMCVSIIGAAVYYSEFNSLTEIAFTCSFLFIIIISLIGTIGKLADDATFRGTRRKALPMATVAAFVFLMLSFQSSAPSVSTANGASGSTVVASSPPLDVNNLKCLPYLTDGAWHYNSACNLLVPGGSRLAYCQTESWHWSGQEQVAAGCTKKFSVVDSDTARKALGGKRVHFCGDSGIRSLYHSMNKLVDPSYNVMQFVNNNVVKHADLNNVYARTENSPSTVFKFKWIPKVDSLSSCFDASNDENDVFVVGMMLWDALEGRDVNAYKTSLVEQLPSVQHRTVLWVHPQHIVNAALRTPEKQQFMTQEIIKTFKAAFDSTASAGHHFAATIDPENISAGKSASSVDGVHYGDDVYDTTTQVVLNAVGIVWPSFLQKSAPVAISPPTPKPPDSMSFPGWGAVVFVTAMVMIFTMDSFFGIGYLALLLSGRTFDYDAAYSPLLKKIFGTDARTNLDPTVALEMGSAPISQIVITEEKESLLRSQCSPHDDTKETA